MLHQKVLDEIYICGLRLIEEMLHLLKVLFGKALVRRVLRKVSGGLSHMLEHAFLLALRAKAVHVFNTRHVFLHVAELLYLPQLSHIHLYGGRKQNRVVLQLLVLVQGGSVDLGTLERSRRLRCEVLQVCQNHGRMRFARKIFAFLVLKVRSLRN